MDPLMIRVLADSYAKHDHLLAKSLTHFLVRFA